MGRGRRDDVTDVPREKKERNACVRYPIGFVTINLNDYHGD